MKEQDFQKLSTYFDSLGEITTISIVESMYRKKRSVDQIKLIIDNNNDEHQQSFIEALNKVVNVAQSLDIDLDAND